MSKKTFVLAHAEARQRCMQFIRDDAPAGYCVTISEPTRTLEQNSIFHAVCIDIAKQVKFADAFRSPVVWKMLLISGHATATRQGSEMLPGLEGEWVNLRESSASMSKSRMTSLIEYCLAFGAQKNVKFSK